MAPKATAAIQVIPVESIERKIYLIRGCKVMLDSDLADLYQVPTKAVNQAIRRNPDRFPDDFMFQLNAEELANLRSQIVTSNAEHGVAMLSSALTSKRAVALNPDRQSVRSVEAIPRDPRRTVTEVGGYGADTTGAWRSHSSDLRLHSKTGGAGGRAFETADRFWMIKATGP